MTAADWNQLTASFLDFLGSALVVYVGLVLVRLSSAAGDTTAPAPFFLRGADLWWADKYTFVKRFGLAASGAALIFLGSWDLLFGFSD